MSLKKQPQSFKILFYGFAFLTMLNFSFMTAAKADTPTQQLTQMLGNLKTFKADFKQVIQDKHGDTIQESTGKMALQRPGLFRWDTQKPNQQLIVADGKFIWVYDKDLQEVTQQKQTNNSASPGLLLSDSVSNLAQRFIISSPKPNDFILKSVKKELFHSVELFFDTSGTLTHMILNDNIGQTTEITFTQSSANQSLSPALFKFNPPKNIDIVQG